MDFGMPFLLETNSIEECCELAQSLGLRFVELNASFHQCLPDQLNIDHLRSLMERYQLYFTLHMDEAFNPFSPNEAVRGVWLDQLAWCLAIAKELNMPTVNMHMEHGVYITLPAERVYLHAQRTEEYQHYVRQLAATVKYALMGSETRLCIENTDGFQPHEQQAIEQLLLLPNVGLTLDLGHMHCIDGYDEAFYQHHLDKLWHMHGHDAAGKHPHLGLGDGEIDLHARFNIAKQCGARVVLETKTIEALKQSIAWLKRKMPELLA